MGARQKYLAEILYQKYGHGNHPKPNGDNRLKDSELFTKDAFSVVSDIPILRLSIYEIYDNRTVNNLIEEANKYKLLEFIHKKITAL